MYITSNYIVISGLIIFVYLIYLYIKIDIKKRHKHKNSRLHLICDNAGIATILFPVYLLYRKPKFTENKIEDIIHQSRKQENPLFPLFFSLFAPGGGHLWLGRLKIGFTLIIVNLIFTLSCAISLKYIIDDISLYLSLRGVIALIFWTLVLLSIFHAVYLSKRISRKKYKFNNPILLLFLILCTNISGFFAVDRFFFPDHDYDWYPGAFPEIYISKIEGVSMEPSLYSNDFLLMHNYSGSFGEYNINRHDIVIVDEKNSSESLLKRVVGIPGDKLRVIPSGLLLGNDLIFSTDTEKPWNMLRPFLKTILVQGGELIIPKGNFLILGDNRNNSFDSLHFGLIEEKNIESWGLLRVGSYGAPNLSLNLYGDHFINRLIDKWYLVFQTFKQHLWVSIIGIIPDKYYQLRRTALAKTKLTKWYNFDVNNNYPPAVFQRGLIAEKNGNFSEAARLYKQSAGSGIGNAQFFLGIFYEKGKGVNKNLKRSLDWYLKSAQQENEWAQLRIGQLYHYGIGVKKNLKKAHDWYTKSSKNGNGSARKWLKILKKQEVLK